MNAALLRRFAQGVGAHHAYMMARQSPDALADALETLERPQGHGCRELVVGREALGKAHHFLVPIDDLQPPAVGLGTRRVAGVMVGDKQMEAVGAQVQRGVGLVGVCVVEGANTAGL